MKRFLSLSIIFLIVIFVLTGCIQPASAIKVKITSASTVSVGSTANFSVTLTASKTGGLGNLFAKDPVVKKVTWTFTHQTQSSKNFSFITNGASGTYTFSAPNNFSTGVFTLSILAVDDKANTYNSKATENVTIEIVKNDPVFSLQYKGESGQDVLLTSLKKNQIVKFVMNSLTDYGISETLIGNYQIKWALSIWNYVTMVYDEIPALVQEYQKYSEKNNYQVNIPEKSKYALNIYIKDNFANVSTFLKRVEFEVVSAIPDVPVLLGHRWGSDGKKYLLEFSRSQDAFYYDVYRQVSLTVQEFAGRVFMPDIASAVVFEDKNPQKGWVTYKVVAVDGDGASSQADFALNVLNRPPYKAQLLAPVGVISSIPDPISGLWAYWTGGEDPDVGDIVSYHVYIKESSDFVLAYSGTMKSVSLNYLFTNGKTYYIRVDSFDGVNTTTGDVYSFSIENYILQAPLITSSSYRYHAASYNWFVELVFAHDNPYWVLQGILTKYVVQFSQYASFPAASTFEETIWWYGVNSFEIPEIYSPKGNPLYARVKAIVSSNRIELVSQWSNVWRVK